MRFTADAGPPYKGALDRWCRRLYWVWRLSPLSRPYYATKTFLFLQWNARKTAIILDDTMRAMGQMHHSRGEPGLMTMPTEVRGKFIQRACWDGLPNWKWRKD